MAIVINELCFACGACEAACPGESISRGDGVFVVDPAICTECVGFYPTQQCARICPVDACVVDESRPETEEVLLERARRLHPELADVELTSGTSHFRA